VEKRPAPGTLTASTILLATHWPRFTILGESVLWRPGMWGLLDSAREAGWRHWPQANRQTFASLPGKNG
jgi:hypothetical protein